eukprot:5524263-Amphidinium_carterae.1
MALKRYSFLWKGELRQQRQRVIVPQWKQLESPVSSPQCSCATKSNTVTLVAADVAVEALR